ncbi:MAG: beta-lactamase family protein [Acidobacteria bacterium]|nr:beta-lactamase family protein [Acidobacteriota bacterium]
MRKIGYNVCAILALVSVAASIAVGAGVQGGSESPALRRAKELASVISKGDRGAAEAYIKENYAPDFMRIPLEQHLAFILALHDRTRGLTLGGVHSEGANEVTLRIKADLTGGWEGLLVRVEAEAPHRIAGIGQRRVDAPSGEAAAARLTEAQMSAELGAYLKKLADADVFSGAVLLAKGDKVIFKGAYGVANKDFNAPNNIATRFNLGSMNKMFTSVAIVQLAERGALSLDDPLSKFVEFPNREAADKIRIKHLLTHTSGLGSYFNRKFVESSRARFRTVDDMMELAKDETLQFEPGARWAYSNTGMLVLGKVIEKASGQNYFDYIRENIYRPAGMTSSGSFDLDRVNPNLAVGYDKQFTQQGVVFQSNIFEHVIRGGPAGGGYSTVEDLHRFAQALLGGKLISAEGVKLALSPKPELNSPGYGYGFQVEIANSIVGHGGGFPGISSNLDMFLNDGYTAVVLSNYGRASTPVLEKIRQQILASRRVDR